MAIPLGAATLAGDEAMRQMTKARVAEEVSLPKSTCRVLYADPPSKYGNSGLDDYGHAERHCPTMSIDDLCELPVNTLADDNAVLFLASGVVSMTCE